MDVSSKVTGLEDFDQAIKKLEGRQVRSVLRRATNQSVQPVVREARRLFDQNVGRQSGTTRRNIKKRSLKKSERNRLNIDLGALVYLDDDGFAGRFWELGFTRYGQHYAPRPFLRPAADSQQAAVINRFGQRAGRILERELRKQSKGQ